MLPEPSIRSFLSLGFRHRRVFMAALLLPLAVGLLIILLTPARYAATGSLLVKFGKGAMVDVSRQQDRPMEVSPGDRREIMQSNVEILRSQEVLGQLAKEIGAANIYPSLKDKNPREAEQAAVTQLLKKDLFIQTLPTSNVVTVSVLHKDPQMSKAMADRLFALFITRQAQVYNAPSTQFLSQQVEMAAVKLAASQRALQQFKNEIGVSSLDEELEQLRKQKTEASTIAFQSIDNARASLAILQAKEAELLTTYRASSPQVKQIRRTIAQAARQVAIRQDDLRIHAQQDASAPKPTGPLAERLSTLDARIAELEARRGEYADLDRQAHLDEETYKSYKLKTEEARASDTLNEKNITRISIIDEPQASLKPVSPRKKLILLASLLSGLLLSCGLCLALEWFDDRLHQPQQLAALLRVPVLASFEQKERL